MVTPKHIKGMWERDQGGGSKHAFCFSFRSDWDLSGFLGRVGRGGGGLTERFSACEAIIPDTRIHLSQKVKSVVLVGWKRALGRLGLSQCENRRALPWRSSPSPSARRSACRLVTRYLAYVPADQLLDCRCGGQIARDPDHRIQIHSGSMDPVG